MTEKENTPAGENEPNHEPLTVEEALSKHVYIPAFLEALAKYGMTEERLLANLPKDRKSMDALLKSAANMNLADILMKNGSTRVANDPKE